MSISSATAGNHLHVAIVYDGRILHRIRQPNGAWSAWGTIAPPEGHEFAEVSCAGAGDVLHLVIKDTNDLYWHDVRAANGQWQGIAQLPDQPLVNG
jgi:hypothetical protein